MDREGQQDKAMKRWYSRLLPRTTRAMTGVAIGIAVAIALLDLVGWLLNVPLLKSIDETDHGGVLHFRCNRAGADQLR